MWFHSLLAFWKSDVSRSRRSQPRAARHGTRLVLERLEDRSLPSSYSAANVSALVADINAANKAGGANTITLTAPTSSPYVLTTTNNSTNGANGLPVIAANDNLTIVGNGGTIEGSLTTGLGGKRSYQARLFEVAGGGSLTLQNMTLENGLATSPVYFSGNTHSLPGVGPAQGGAIYNLGALTLNGVTLANNQAVAGSNGQEAASAYGGAIWSDGSLTLENGTLFEGNSAQAGQLRTPDGSALGGAVYVAGGAATISNTTFTGNSVTEVAGGGGLAVGGAIYVAAGQVTLTNSTVNNNSAASAGGLPAWGGSVYIGGGTVSLSGDTLDSNDVIGGDARYGGGLFIAGGTVTLSNTTVQGNVASGGGGGLYIVSGATVYLDPFTVANTINNTDSSGLNGSTANVDGTYLLT